MVTGTGIFKKATPPAWHAALILQGHGNSCARLEDFTRWTLVVYGQGSEYSLFGDLNQGPQEFHDKPPVLR